MICQKMKKHFYIGLSAFMALYFSLCSCIGSYASTTDSGNSVTIQEQWADNVYNNFQTVIQDSLKVAIPKNEAEQIWNNYVDHCYSIWNLEYDDLHQHYGHFRDYVGAQFEMEKNPDNTYNYNMSEDAYTFIQDSFNTYVQSNPLGYTQCFISSYQRINATQFQTYNQYATVKALCEANPNTYAVMWRSFSNPNYTYRICFLPKVTQLFLYGTVSSSGSFNSVSFAYNWAANSQPQLSIQGSKAYTVTVNGQSAEMALNSFSIGALDNSTSVWYPGGAGQQNKYTVFSTLNNNEMVYVFSSINAFKVYNSGSAQPYYMESDFTGIIDPSGYNVPNTNNSYESIVNNVQNGWTAQEVLELVDRIMSTGSGSGNGSGNGGNDSSGLWSRIGDAIGNLIDGIINVLTTVIEHLSDALLSVIHLLTGYTDDNGVVHEGLFGKLLNLVNSGFNNFLASIFSWLPEEIVTLFTAVLVFGIFFGLLKMLRR